MEGKNLRDSREEGEIALERQDLMSGKKLLILVSFYHWINFRVVFKLCTLINVIYKK